jgi:hypothetical protein
MCAVNVSRNDAYMENGHKAVGNQRKDNNNLITYADDNHRRNQITVASIMPMVIIDTKNVNTKFIHHLGPCQIESS